MPAISSLNASKQITIDIDLSAPPVSKQAAGATKGYVPKRKNVYTRQLGRVLIPQTQEIVTQSLYTGNTPARSVLKEMVDKMEVTLKLDTQAKRRQIQLRLDAGFGTDANINFALWRDYQILVKVYSWKRANALAQSVDKWTAVPSGADNAHREAGWVTKPHRYGRKTVQVAVRTPNNKGGYSYSVLVTTDTQTTLAEIVSQYDKRSGVPESTFCQDYQGLSMRKRRKTAFEAQQVLVLLSQVAHNLLIWSKGWLVEAIVDDEYASQPEAKTLQHQTISTIEARGIKRLMREVLWVSGEVCFKNKKVTCIILNPLYPLIDRIITALQAFLKPYKIRVLLGET